MTQEPPEPVEPTTVVGFSATADQHGRRVPAGRVPVSRLRSAGFAVSVLVLAGAVPVLGWVGLTLIRESRAGKLVTRVSDPRAPGYEAIVDPTPTALILQKDANGDLGALTFIALGGAAGGGSAMFLPLDTAIADPVHPGDRYRSVYRADGQPALVSQVGTTLNAGLSDVIAMDNGKWAALTANSAPIEFDNPDALTSGSSRFPAGRISLGSGQVGPYLTALNRGESELNRLNRNQLFWQAWLKKIAASRASNVIPGETRSGIGFYVHTMSDGPVRLEPMPVKPGVSKALYGGTLFEPIGDMLRRDVAAMVPFPTAPMAGARIGIRLLNGADGKVIPQSVVQLLVRSGAAIAIVGNDRHFGRAETVIQYRDPAGRNEGLLLQHALGGRVKVARNLQAPDDVDLTIILGRDLLPTSRKPTRDPTSPTTARGLTTTTTRSRPTGG